MSRDVADSHVAAVYVGMADSVEAELAGRAGIAFEAIESGQLRGMAPWVAARSLWRMARGARQAAQLVAKIQPDVTLVTGGYVAAPVVWASWRAGVPVLIYLPDIEPGLAIRRLARFAARVAVSFPEVAGYFPGKAVVTGYPVRREFLAAAHRRDEARRRLALDADMPALLVFGGSRGARSINQALADALPQLLDLCQVIHISGIRDWSEVQQRAEALPQALRDRYHASPYLHEELPLAMAAADLVVARAGAATLGEFPAMGLPAILIPYPYSGQHQQANANYLADRGAAVTVLDGELQARLAPAVLELLGAPSKLRSMSQAMSALAQPQAATNIARELQRLAVPSRRGDHRESVP